MKPQNNLKSALFIFVLLLAGSAFSQIESKIESKACTSNLEVKSTEVATTTNTKVIEDKKNTPILTKAISGLNSKIDNVIFENKMMSVRSSASISFTDRN